MVIKKIYVGVVVFALLGLLVYVLLFSQDNSNRIINQVLPIDKSGYWFECVQVQNLEFSDENESNLIINNQTGNSCQIERQNLNSIDKSLLTDDTIELDFIVTILEKNCDDAINKYDSLYLSRDKKLYQCFRGSPT